MSLFAEYERMLPAVQAERQMSAAQAALYPHVTKDGAQQMWRGWMRQIERVSRDAQQQARALFTVDGKAVGLRGLKDWMRRRLGRRAEVD